ncbi:hypothetical protein HDU76_014130 [Blyttiomyces sp. JEL0837]|nr:hypothetical protein HDU76_014130 [Blyttiomyces sp. JEL0837]
MGNLLSRGESYYGSEPSKQSQQDYRRQQLKQQLEPLQTSSPFRTRVRSTSNSSTTSSAPPSSTAPFATPVEFFSPYSLGLAQQQQQQQQQPPPPPPSQGETVFHFPISTAVDSSTPVDSSVSPAVSQIFSSPHQTSPISNTPAFVPPFSAAAPLVTEQPEPAFVPPAAPTLSLNPPKTDFEPSTSTSTSIAPVVFAAPQQAPSTLSIDPSAPPAPKTGDLFYLPTASTLAHSTGARRTGSLVNRRTLAFTAALSGSKLKTSNLALSTTAPVTPLIQTTPHILTSAPAENTPEASDPDTSTDRNSQNLLPRPVPQPPRLDLSSFAARSTLVSDSPMSAGGPKPGANVAALITSSLDPSAMPRWLDHIAGLGVTQAPPHFERMYKVIEDSERARSGRVNSSSVSISSASSSSPTTDGPVTFSVKVATDKGNLRRNRYVDILPYDHARVPLVYPSPLPPARQFANATGTGGGQLMVSTGPRTSDYINASFLDSTPSAKERERGGGFYANTPGRRYISTQGPLPETVGDFWAMVWDQEVRVIVMLTKSEERGRIKCHRYWPGSSDQGSAGGSSAGGGGGWFGGDDDKDEKIGAVGVHPHGPEFTVTRRSVATTVRTPTSATDGGAQRSPIGMGAGGLLGPGTVEVRTVRQIQYLGWPDHKSSDARSVLAVIDLANSLQAAEPMAGPMVVHCSAGCGRTGTFCVIDSVLMQMESGAFARPTGEFEKVWVREEQPRRGSRSLTTPEPILPMGVRKRLSSFMNVPEPVGEVDEKSPVVTPKGAAADLKDVEMTDRDDAVSTKSRGAGQRDSMILDPPAALNEESVTVTVTNPAGSVGASGSGSNNKRESTGSLIGSSVNTLTRSSMKDSPPSSPAPPPHADWEDPVFACVMRFRQQRVSMVQTLDQFAFCYEAIVTRMIDWQKEGRAPSWAVVREAAPRPPSRLGSEMGSFGVAGVGSRGMGGWGRTGANYATTPLIVPATAEPQAGPVFDWGAALKRFVPGDPNKRS